MMRNVSFSCLSYWILGLDKTYKIAWNHLGPLMDKLIKRMLSIRPRFSKYYFPRVITNKLPIIISRFTIAFHLYLLGMGGKLRKRL